MLTYLSDDTFEAFLNQISNNDSIDLSNVSFIDPYGMVGVLEAGRYLKSSIAEKNLILPSSDNVLRYLERMDFFKYAKQYFNLISEKRQLSDKYLRSHYTDVLLEITPIAKSDDIHFIVNKVKKRAHTILHKHLHYNERAINGFIVSLSEICQNIVEHSEHTGFVGIQKYRFHKLDRNVVKIAVMDLGIGFRSSLSQRVPMTNDLSAIEDALLHGISRHEDKGRGHGLKGVKRFVRQWHGKISIRSGTARYSIIPDWGWGRERERNLGFFPGSQINILLPEVVS
jgi:anti-sigma regulatory factor (Ser/Thr protein kinase)